MPLVAGDVAVDFVARFDNLFAQIDAVAKKFHDLSKTGFKVKLEIDEAKLLKSVKNIESQTKRLASTVDTVHRIIVGASAKVATQLQQRTGKTAGFLTNTIASANKKIKTEIEFSIGTFKLFGISALKTASILTALAFATIPGYVSATQKLTGVTEVATQAAVQAGTAAAAASVEVGWWTSTWEALSRTLEPVGASIQRAAEYIIPGASAAIVEFNSYVVELSASIGAWFASFFDFNQWILAFDNGMRSLGAAIAGVYMTVSDFLAPAFEWLDSLFGNFFSNIWQGIKSLNIFTGEMYAGVSILDRFTVVLGSFTQISLAFTGMSLAAGWLINRVRVFAAQRPASIIGRIVELLDAAYLGIMNIVSPLTIILNRLTIVLTTSTILIGTIYTLIGATTILSTITTSIFVGIGAVAPLIQNMAAAFKIRMVQAAAALGVGKAQFILFLTNVRKSFDIMGRFITQLGQLPKAFSVLSMFKAVWTIFQGIYTTLTQLLAVVVQVVTNGAKALTIAPELVGHLQGLNTNLNGTTTSLYNMNTEFVKGRGLIRSFTENGIQALDGLGQYAKNFGGNLVRLAIVQPLLTSLKGLGKVVAGPLVIMLRQLSTIIPPTPEWIKRRLPGEMMRERLGNMFKTAKLMFAKGGKEFKEGYKKIWEPFQKKRVLTPKIEGLTGRNAEIRSEQEKLAGQITKISTRYDEMRNVAREAWQTAINHGKEAFRTLKQYTEGPLEKAKREIQALKNEYDLLKVASTKASDSAAQADKKRLEVAERINQTIRVISRRGIQDPSNVLEVQKRYESWAASAKILQKQIERLEKRKTELGRQGRKLRKSEAEQLDEARKRQERYAQGMTLLKTQVDSLRQRTLEYHRELGKEKEAQRVLELTGQKINEVSTATNARKKALLAAAREAKTAEQDAYNRYLYRMRVIAQEEQTKKKIDASSIKRRQHEIFMLGVERQLNEKMIASLQRRVGVKPKHIYTMDKAIKKATASVNNHLQTVKNSPNAYKVLETEISKIWDKHTDIFGSRGGGSQKKNFINALMGDPSLIPSMFAKTEGSFKRFFGRSKETFSKPFTEIKSLARKLEYDTLALAAEWVIRFQRLIFDGVPSSVKDAFSRAADVAVKDDPLKKIYERLSKAGKGKTRSLLQPLMKQLWETGSIDDSKVTTMLNKLLGGKGMTGLKPEMKARLRATVTDTINSLTSDAVVAGKKIPQMLSQGIDKGRQYIVKSSASMAQTLRDHVPASPPKMGPLAGNFLQNAGRKIVRYLSFGMLSEDGLLASVFSQLLSNAFLPLTPLGWAAQAVKHVIGMFMDLGGTLTNLANNRFFQSLKQVADDITDIGLAASRFGMAEDVEGYDRLRRAFQYAHLEGSQLEQMLNMLRRRVSEAEGGNIEAAAQFERLGISVTAVSEGTVGMDEALMRVVRHASTLRQGTKEWQETLDLIGSSYGKLQNVATQGGFERILEGIQRVDEIGSVIDEGDVESAEKMNYTFIDIRESIDAVKRELFVNLFPILQGWFDRVHDFWAKYKDTVLGGIRILIEAFGLLLNMVTDRIAGWTTDGEKFVQDMLILLTFAVRSAMVIFRAVVTQFIPILGSLLSAATRVFFPFFELIWTAAYDEFKATVVQAFMWLVRVPFSWLVAAVGGFGEWAMDWAYGAIVKAGAFLKKQLFLILKDFLANSAVEWFLDQVGLADAGSIQAEIDAAQSAVDSAFDDARSLSDTITDMYDSNSASIARFTTMWVEAIRESSDEQLANLEDNTRHTAALVMQEFDKISGSFETALKSVGGGLAKEFKSLVDSLGVEEDVDKVAAKLIELKSLIRRAADAGVEISKEAREALDDYTEQFGSAVWTVNMIRNELADVDSGLADFASKIFGDGGTDLIGSRLKDMQTSLEMQAAEKEIQTQIDTLLAKRNDKTAEAIDLRVADLEYLRQMMEYRSRMASWDRANNVVKTLFDQSTAFGEIAEAGAEASGSMRAFTFERSALRRELEAGGDNSEAILGQLRGSLQSLKTFAKITGDSSAKRMVEAFNSAVEDGTETDGWMAFFDKFKEETQNLAVQNELVKQAEALSAAFREFRPKAGSTLAQIDQDFEDRKRDLAKQFSDFRSQTNDAILKALAAKDTELARNLQNQLIAAYQRYQELIRESSIERVRRIREEAEKQFLPLSEEIGGNLADGISQAVIDGLDGNKVIIGDVFREITAAIRDSAVNSLVTDLTERMEKGLTDMFVKVFDFAEEQGSVWANTLMLLITSVITAILDANREEMEATQAQVDSMVESTEQVRGLISGETNVAIKEVSDQLRDALQPTNAILSDIRDNTLGLRALGGLDSAVAGNSA